MCSFGIVKSTLKFICRLEIIIEDTATRLAKYYIDTDGYRMYHGHG